MRRIVLLPAIAAIAAFAIYVYLNPFMFMPIETKDCGNDTACIREMKTKIQDCVPSSTIITGRDGIMLMVNITREGDKCVQTETVIGSEELQSRYLIGRNATCETNLSDTGPRICPGSLYDYVMFPEGGGDPGGAKPPGIPVLTCSLDDHECKTTADSYLQNCVSAKITNTEYRWLPDGYWTMFFDVSRLTEECHYFVEVLNAINLPPGTPITIIGSNMTCDIPLSEFPVGPLNSTWCEGSLYDYLHP